MKKLPKKFFGTKKDKETQVKPQKSPSNSRSITEKRRDYFSWARLATMKAHWEVIFVSFISGVFLMGIGIAGLDVWGNVQELEKRQAMREGLTKEKQYWEGIVKKYPDYKDAYFQLGIASYQLGERDEAYKAIERVLEIDPNAKEAQEFAKKLTG